MIIQSKMGMIQFGAHRETGGPRQVPPVMFVSSPPKTPSPH